MSVGTPCVGCSWTLTWDNTCFTGSPPVYLSYPGYMNQPLCNDCGNLVKKKLPLIKRNTMDQKLPGKIIEKEKGKIYELSGHVFISGQKLAEWYTSSNPPPTITLLPGAVVTIL